MASLSPYLLQNLPTLCTRILSKFPQQYFRYCFAYGSGVFKQQNYGKSNPMIDMIFVVDDAQGFHGQNVLLNPKHYSALKYTGHRFLEKVQKLPAGVYFNTLITVPEENTVIKYGVISRTDFINDLLDWNYLYIAGRLHKPTFVVLPTASEDILTALRINLISALHAALLILPEYFTERQLYKIIVGLSYNGDFRMKFGENKNKVVNIVDSQVNELRALYGELLPSFDNYMEVPVSDSVDQTCAQDLSPSTRMFHLFQLPKVPQQAITTYWRHHHFFGGIRHDTEDILKAVAHHPQVSSITSSCLRNVVFSSSLRQSLKGIFTAGFLKSVRYSSSKIRKMILSKQPVKS